MINIASENATWLHEPEIVDLDSQLRPDFATNRELPRHRWFYFKEGFSASLVANTILNIQRRPGFLLEPFLGSGTTALEASKWGWHTYGIEVNPFIAFVARTKTTPNYRYSEVLRRAFQAVEQKDNKPNWRLPRNTTLVEKKGLEKWFFNFSVVRRFEKIRTAISLNNGGKYRDILMLALIVAMCDVANARRDGKCWRYKTSWQSNNYSGKDLEIAFLRKIAEYAEDLEVLGTLSGKTSIHVGDVRVIDKIKKIPQGRIFDGVVTSPPYLNSFDYTDIYRPEMLLLGVAKSSKDLRKYRLKTLRSHVQINWPKSIPCSIHTVRDITSKIKQLDLWDKRLIDMINAYFVDLEVVIRNCLRRVKLGGLMSFVVANSAYAGIVIPVDECLIEIFQRNDMKIIDYKVLRETPGNGNHQRRSSNLLREVLITARVDQ